MKEKQQEIDQEMIQEIIDSVAKIRYGEVVITVYNSKIVQIEEKKKKRFT